MDDGTLVEVLRDRSERPLVPQVHWARVDAATEEEIAAQIAEAEARCRRMGNASRRPRDRPPRQVAFALAGVR